ncbi:type VII secretion integral membrane protein EccD [Mycolicibacterium tusciae]|uniref:Type VII secretion integral membrane protein EccD n=1 Tax=Mycolicibacterium tusciae TaxID=75922 RepID=A0A1X0JVQ5_9MYCO|nr:type VII secretion integral membrane protein EccD [Mycolicibacterium tusciae]ORB66881.1 type VII secretion integral membrane protein EccD [Mycolicibacterium tusciae]
MPDSLCRLTVASCTDDAHRAVDLALPADVSVGELVPQIVDLVHRDGTQEPGLDWVLSKLGEPPMTESESLNDNDVRDGDLLILTTTEPAPAEWSPCDPCHAVAADRTTAPRMLPAIACVLLGGCGAAALAWPAAGVAMSSRIVVGACLAVAAGVGAVVIPRLRGDPLICVTLSMITVLYAGATGFLTVRTSTAVAGLLLASATIFAVAILLLRVTTSGRTCLTAIATLAVLVSATAAAAVSWRLQLSAGGAMVVGLSLATLGFTPRLAMAFTGITPDTAPNVRRCHQTLTGLVAGSSAAAALGAIAVVVAEVCDAGSALRGTSFIAIVALVLLLRVRTHVDATRRASLAGAGVLCLLAGFAAAAVAAPAHAHVASVLAVSMGAAALGGIVRPTVSPIALRTVEVIECVAIAAVIPMACWVGGIYGWARGMNLI